MAPYLIIIVEKFLYISLGLFILTTFHMIRIVKKENSKLIKEAVTSLFYPNLNLTFFSEIRNEYYRIKKSNFLALINRVSFYVLLIGLISLIFLVVLEEFIRAI